MLPWGIELMKTTKIDVSGIVQGVGFRPFVYTEALALKLKGEVFNHSQGVTIFLQGEESLITRFIENLTQKHPAQACIDSFQSHSVEKFPYQDFQITESQLKGSISQRISPDMALCDQCQKELLDPGNRRFLYPYINCTHCGPRFTIIKALPYDRKNTTMADFPMCSECLKEYQSPQNRRFHAQPNACHQCGPHYKLTNNAGQPLIEPKSSRQYKDLLNQTRELLNEGHILGIKGLGGYHLVCDGRSSKVVKELRKRKKREEKPLAVMVKNLEQAKKLAYISKQESEYLLAPDQPIVLLKSRKSSSLCPEIAPGNQYIGIMLPCTPFQHMLFEWVDFPLVMTSANLSDEPIAFQDDEAIQRLSKICDFFIQGNRDILIRCDDSVIAFVSGKRQIIRRSRGFAPHPINSPLFFDQGILALGAEQKNTFLLAFDNYTIPSHHIGDLKDMRTFDSFQDNIQHLSSLYDFKPKILVSDLHPLYLSTLFMRKPPEKMGFPGNIQKIQVQHHHAHIASVMAENNLSTPVIGIALDGTGLGKDNTIWGGEILFCEYHDFKRIGHLLPVTMPGGDRSVKYPWQMGLSYLMSAWPENWKEKLPPGFKAIEEATLKLIARQIEKQINSPVTSSCGRLFDGVAALLGTRHQVAYEGQAAIELEQLASGLATEAYAMDILPEDDQIILDWRPMIRQISEDIIAQKAAAEISMSFHQGLIQGIGRALGEYSKERPRLPIALSGGCFMNRLLLSGLTGYLEQKGFEVYTAISLPLNDGGLALGQAAIAKHMLEQRG
ncbi:MAG: carbamoyltransferase HypF [Spirochaetales bacterium]|nr:carbamoyltransferase HypF [Spirochaetales bacterium]